MSDQRPDDETLGRALGRAVETQSVRETPYSGSRLAARIDRPARRGWTYALPAIAALALFVAMGAFFAGRGPFGVANPDPSASPDATARATPDASPTASARPSSSPTATPALAYSVPAEKTVTIDGEQRAATATTTVSNEVVAPALGRLAIELQPTTPVPSGFWSPSVKAEHVPTIPPSESKWALAVTLLGVTDPRAGSLVGAGSLSQVEGSPIRALRVRREASGVTYELYLDDARPWRIGLQRGINGAMIVLVDIGGHPSAITTGTAVYTPVAGATVGRSVTVSGLARAFEATVSWRVRDSAGRQVAEGFSNASIGTSPYYGTFEFTAQIPASVSGNVTLDVFQASPRDGSDTSKVSIPLQVR